MISKTNERMDEVANFFAQRMSEQDLRDYAITSFKEEYLEDGFIFQDDWGTMQKLIEIGE